MVEVQSGLSVFKTTFSREKPFSEGEGLVHSNNCFDDRQTLDK